MSILDKLLQLAGLVIAAIGATVKGNPTEIEAAILQVVQAGASAYEAQKGQPIDPSLLKPIDPVM